MAIFTGKKVEGETYLPASSIDGNEQFRLIKARGNAWNKFRTKFSDLATYVLSQLVASPFSLQLQSDWTDTNTSSVRYIRNKSVTATVATMQGLVGIFNPDAWYIITDPVGSFGILRIRARDASTLEKAGTLLKAGKTYAVEYSLDDGSGIDSLTYFRDDFYNNTFWNYFGTSFIALAPLDGSWSANVFYVSSTPTISSTAKIAINGCVFETGSFFNLDHNGSADAQPIQIGGSYFGIGCGLVVLASSTGGTSLVSTVIAQGSSSLRIADAGSCVNCLISNNSNLIVDDNGADGTTLISGSIENSVNLTVNGISGGTGTILDNCNISGVNTTVTIKGGETYRDKIMTKVLSTFDGNRTVTADGAFSFIDSDLVANYNRTFIGEWAVAAAAPHNITSFTDRDITFSHKVTFTLAAGSSGITFVDDGVNIIMKGSSNVALTAENDYVTFRFIGQVAYELDRGKY